MKLLPHFQATLANNESYSATLKKKLENIKKNRLVRGKNHTQRGSKGERAQQSLKALILIMAGQWLVSAENQNKKIIKIKKS